MVAKANAIPAILPDGPCRTHGNRPDIPIMVLTSVMFQLYTTALYRGHTQQRYDDGPRRCRRMIQRSSRCVQTGFTGTDRGKSVAIAFSCWRHSSKRLDFQGGEGFGTKLLAAWDAVIAMNNLFRVPGGTPNRRQTGRRRSPDTQETFLKAMQSPRPPRPFREG